MMQPLCPKCREPVQGELSADGVCPACAGPGIGYWLLLILACGAAYGVVGMWLQDYVAAVVLIGLTLAAFSGYRIGAVNLLALFGGIGLSVAATPYISPYLKQTAREYLGWDGLGLRLSILLFTGLAVTLLITLVVRATVGRYVRRRGWLRRTNRLLGAALGIAQGAAVATLLLAGLMMLEPLLKARLDSVPAEVEPADNPYIRPWTERLVAVAEQTRSSAVGPVAERANPTRQMPELEHSLLVAADKEALQSFMKHPDVARLAEEPDIKAAWKEVAQDPEIQLLLGANEKLDPEELSAFMRSPRAWELLQETELLSLLHQSRDDLKPALAEAAQIARENQGEGGRVKEEG